MQALTIKNAPVDKGDLIYFSKHQNTKTFVLIDSLEAEIEFYYSFISKDLRATLIFGGSFINHAKVIDIVKA